MSSVGTARSPVRRDVPSTGGKRILVKQVDAFTETPLAGNPAGVVVDASGLSDHQMQMIAHELAAPETAFILPTSRRGANLRIRWFSPATEVPLCGHATIAAFHALAEEKMHGMSTPGNYSFVLETLSGNLPLTVEKRKEGAFVFFGLNVPVFVRAGQYKMDIMRLLGISLQDLENRLPIVADKYLYVPVRRLHSLHSIKPNMFALSRFLTGKNLGGLCVFTLETVEKTSAVHSRFFAPNLGVDEDVVTGSANGPLGVYLFQQGYLKHTGKVVTLTGEQGDVLGRKGRVTVELTLQGNEVQSVRIGGRAVTVMTAGMLIG